MYRCIIYVDGLSIKKGFVRQLISGQGWIGLRGSVSRLCRLKG